MDFKGRTELELGEFWDGGIINSKGAYSPVKFIGIHQKLTKELLDDIFGRRFIGLKTSMKTQRA